MCYDDYYVGGAPDVVKVTVTQNQAVLDMVERS